MIDDMHSNDGGDVVIDDYVWIASRVTKLPGVRIGRGGVITSNSVVIRDVPPMSIAAGIPAKVIGERRRKLKYQLFY
jgi:maltose O-acetyltransferase